MSVEVFVSRDDLIERTVEIVTAAASRGAIALSGGATPIPVYEALARRDVRASWFQVDERCVPFGDTNSNATTIERAGLPLVRVDTTLDPDDAAETYERSVRATWGATGPFALAILGIGEDGHIASLFPGAPELEDDRWVIATREAHNGHRRVTMTLPLINAILQRVFIVTGAGKREVVRRALAGDSQIPASAVRDPIWLVDKDAAP